MSFRGKERLTLKRHLYELADTFTYELWVRSDVSIDLDREADTGESGIVGKRYAVAPILPSVDGAGVGIAIGVNGIAIYEHAVNHLPAVLVHSHNFSDWTHVAVVYQDRTPSLYIDGHLVKTGHQSIKTHVFPSAELGGHDYGHFIGDIREFRVWSSARTAQEILALWNARIQGDEFGLTWYWKPQGQFSIRHGVMIKPIVSVIMPSHNRFPLNALTIRSLEAQTFPRECMEVIFVDDGSTDETQDLIGSVSPTLPFTYIHSNENKGRAKARNLGIRASSGEVLLFIDSEMICPSRFVQRHAMQHSIRPNLVLSAAMDMRRVLTFMLPGLNADQIAHAYSLYEDKQDIISAIDSFFYQNERVHQLVSLEDVQSDEFLKRHSYLVSYFDEILNHYGYDFDGFRFPWMNFVTNNVSVPRKLIDRVGMFDDRFEGFGWEDWELGYRLYKDGATFIHDPGVKNFHQEHPIAETNSVQSRKNFRLFQAKHPDIDVRVFVLDMIPNRWTFDEMNALSLEYNRLGEKYPNQFSAAKQGLYALLDQVSICFVEHRPISNIVSQSSLSPEDVDRIRHDLSDRKMRKGFPTIVKALEFLLEL